MATSPKDKQAVNVKWIYRITKNEREEVAKFKARLVAKGYSQRQGIGYEEVFTLVAWLETIRLIMALTTQNKWRVYQMDVKSNFLNGQLEEEMYIQ